MRRTVIQNIKNGTISLNGQQVAGRNIVINGDVVTVDGVIQNDVETQQLTIEIHGDVERVETDYGDVSAQNITGKVKTMSGDVTVSGEISGDVKTMSGDVKASAIRGDVSTMSGDITER